MDNIEICKNEMIIKASDIIEFMQDFCSSQGLDLKTLSHNQYKAVCLAIGLKFFNDSTALLYINNNKNMGIDYIKLYHVFTVYNNICMLYDKIPNMLSFSYFINLDYGILYNNINEPKYIACDEKSSRACKFILQKLNESRESSLKDRAIDKGGAVGVAIVGNTEYFWNTPQNRPYIENNNTGLELPSFQARTAIE